MLTKCELSKECLLLLFVGYLFNSFHIIVEKASVLVAFAKPGQACVRGSSITAVSIPGILYLNLFV